MCIALPAVLEESPDIAFEIAPELAAELQPNVEVLP